MHKQDIKNLKFRYLLWLYKSTKEELDKVERKFTQVEIDKELLHYLRLHADSSKIKDKAKLDKLLREFRQYIFKKEKDGRDLKFSGRRLKPEYYFLLLKLQAIEKVITEQLGQAGKKQIKALYEEEMRKRILESKGGD